MFCCGLNIVLGASPDGKVIDLHENPVYGIVEIKCPEEYKYVSPREKSLSRSS